MPNLAAIFSLINYKEPIEQISYTKMLAYRGCFNHPQHYISNEKNKASLGYMHRSDLALKTIEIWEKLNLQAYYPFHEGHLIPDEEAKILLQIQFSTLEEGFIWLSNVTDIYFLRQEFEGESVFENTTSINTDRWNNLNQINPAIINSAKNLHLMDEYPWPDQSIHHVVLMSSIEPFVQDRMRFLQAFNGCLYFISSPRGLFNNEPSLAYILADWFKVPEKVKEIQQLLHSHSHKDAPLQWHRNLSGLKKEILSLLQVQEWPKAPQSYYYLNKAIYDKSAQMYGRERLDCLGGAWPVAADMGWYHFPMKHQPQIKFIPLVTRGRNHKLVTMDEMIGRWLKLHGLNIIEQGEPVLFVSSNNMHMLPCVLSNLIQSNYYQQAILQNNMQQKLLQFKENKLIDIADKIKIAGPSKQCMSEHLIFDSLAKSIFPLRKNIKKIINERLFVYAQQPPVILKKMIHYHQFNSPLYLSDASIDLAIEYKNKHDLIKSNGLLNFSFNVLNKSYNFKLGAIKRLIHECTLLNLENFLNHCPVLPKAALLDHHHLQQCDLLNKTTLQDIRIEISKIFREKSLGNPDFFLKNSSDVYQVCSILMRNYFTSIIQQSLDSFGLDINAFSFGYLGSNSRMQATPFSDVEFFILVQQDTEQTVLLAKELTKLILLKVINLGETALSAFNISYKGANGESIFSVDLLYDTYTPDGFSLDQNVARASKTPLGRKYNNEVLFRLIGTPEFMVQQCASFFGYKLNKYFPLAIRSTHYICGNKILYGSFVEKLEKLSTIDIPAYSEFLFKTDLIKFSSALNRTALLPKVTNKLYVGRPIDILIECLFMASGQIGGLSSYDKLDKLYAARIISFSQFKNLTEILNFILWLKLYLHLKFNEQKIDISVAEPFYPYYLSIQAVLKKVYDHFYYCINTSDSKILQREQGISIHYNQHLFFKGMKHIKEDEHYKKNQVFSFML